jgi:hypothetical protein
MRFNLNVRFGAGSLDCPTTRRKTSPIPSASTHLNWPGWIAGWISLVVLTSYYTRRAIIEASRKISSFSESWYPLRSYALITSDFGIGAVVNDGAGSTGLHTCRFSNFIGSTRGQHYDEENEEFHTYTISYRSFNKMCLFGHV